MKYRKSSHATYDCRYHIVWITKYRRQVLDEKIQKKLKGIIEAICKEMYVKILALGFEEDYVHLYVSIPLTHPIPSVVHRLKGRTSKVIWEQYSSYLKKFYWEKNVLWAV
jgi:putative transposase